MLTPKQKAQIRKHLEVDNQIYGKGVVIAVAFGIEIGGVNQEYRGMVVRQMQYGMDAVHFDVDAEITSYRFLSKRRVICLKQSR